MSGDEILALVVSIVIGLLGWRPWVGGLFGAALSRKPAARFQGVLFPLLSAAAVLFVLRRWAAHDVRDDAVYLCFYFVMWFGWVGTMSYVLTFVGLSGRDDVLERGNTAAGLAVGGAIVGLTLTFAGGNIGDGPGWWVVVFSAGLASATLIALWAIGGAFGRIADVITIDRDDAAGWRALGFFVGGGLILGRAVAGDWKSASQTVADFIARGWPVLLLWAVWILFDLAFRPTPRQPWPDRIVFGVFPCLVYLATGVGAVLWQGPWK